MEVGQYLEKYQTAAYKIFKNAFEKNRLSHAYLLIGEQGIPLKEIALFLAKSLVCENPNPLACEHCINCYRVDEGNYADVKLFDGKEKTIKKSDISNLTETFSKTAIEEKGVVIYILNNIENMTVEATNSLLKFLEEPEEDIIAILLTQNRYKILETILSRCQILTIKENSMPIIEDDLYDLLKCVINPNDFYIKYSSIVNDIIQDKDIAKEKLEKIENIIILYLENKYNNKEIDEKLIKIFKDIDSNKLLNILKIIEDEIKRLEFNVNYKLWLDALFSRLTIGG